MQTVEMVIWQALDNNWSISKSYKRQLKSWLHQYFEDSYSVVDTVLTSNSVEAFIKLVYLVSVYGSYKPHK